MQTFLPYRSFKKSARCLDTKRLGNQRNEAWVCLQTITGQSDGWKHHPAILMWVGYESALRAYGRAICNEWRRRGYNDTMLERFDGPRIYRKPPWLGNEEFHSSHRANLLRKNPEWYGQFGWTEDPSSPYVWPTKLVSLRG